MVREYHATKEQADRAIDTALARGQREGRHATYEEAVNTFFELYRS